MAKSKCHNSPVLINTMNIVIQVTFIFAFLTLFFFLYVRDVERKEFEHQLRYVVDNLVADVLNEVPKGDLRNYGGQALVNNLISVLERKMTDHSKGKVEEVQQRNQKVRTRAYKTLATVIGLVVLTSMGMIILGYCLPLGKHVREAMWVVVFVGLTELLFLELVAKRYISASPNAIKRSIAQAVQNWIRRRK